MDADEAVGKRIEDLRSARGLSQGQLSDLVRAAGLNWSQGTVSRVEAGTRPVRFTEAFTVAKALGVEVVALAHTGGGLEYVYQQDLGTVIAARRHLRKSERQVEQSIAMAQVMRFAVELSEGRQGPYVVHSSTASITYWLAGHLRTPVEGVLELLGIPRAVADHQLARADSDFQSIEKSGLDPEWDGPDYAPNLGEWIRRHMDDNGSDPALQDSQGWRDLLDDLHDQLRSAAVVSLWRRYFPFVTEVPHVWYGGMTKDTPPIVEGIDTTDIDEQMNLPVQFLLPASALEVLDGHRY
ncbi:helix-turn-helix domain-containing protein [Rhodococcus sp. W8901]|uniref:helix-turn-helix domain-containing protein n=1 Tax=Rhodococcus sp. W8901 TaxID=2742603 RepID=UPI001583B968|nr:helix-turn-helix transcriptional regulator [Rhodococcus sp. W8901]QKT12171.1 helix-turn-helix transcriptional regulator [Rhodococcus sp. W8901]